MYTLNSNNVVPYMILYEDVFNKKNELLLPSNTVLSANHIQLLIQNGYKEITLADLTETKKSRYEHLHSYPHFLQFEKLYFDSLDRFIHVVNNLNLGLVFQPRALLDIRNRLFKGLTNEEQFIDYLFYLSPSPTQMTYTHCFNMGLLSYCFAKWCHLSVDTVDEICLAGFLCDLGLTKIDKRILYKSDPLTKDEQDTITKHVFFSYDMLKNENLERVSQLILTHHEKNDGSGYPFQLRSNQLTRYTTILALADEYEALTHLRSYRQAINPFNAIEALENAGLNKYVYSTAQSLLYKIAFLHVGRRVVLSNGTIGKIVKINKAHIGRPVIYSVDGLIDLSNRSDIKIIRMH